MVTIFERTMGDIKILNSLLELAYISKANSTQFLMCRSLATIITSREEEDRIMQELIVDIVPETHLQGRSTAWYPIDDIESRITNVKRTINRLSIQNTNNHSLIQHNTL